MATTEDPRALSKTDAWGQHITAGSPSRPHEPLPGPKKAARVAPRAAGRALLDDLRDRERAALHARYRRRRLRARPRVPGRVSVHARRLSLDVPRPALDDAPVRRLRHGCGDER